MESASSVLETKDGGYILLSYSDFQGSLEEGISPRLGAWLIKTDPNGDEEWIKKYGWVDLYDDVLNIDEGVMYVCTTRTQ